MYYIFVICDNRLISSRVKIKVHKKQCENEYYEDNKPHKLSRIDKKKKKSRKNTLSVIGHTRRGATVFIKINYENYEKA